MSQSSIDFRYAPAESQTPICRPDDPHKSLVRDDGALLYDFQQQHLGCWFFGRTVEFRAQTSHRPLSVEQRTESARVPIVVTTISYPTCRLELRAIGHRDETGARYDIVQWSLDVAQDADEILTGLHIDIHEHGVVRHAGTGAAPSAVVYALRPDQVPEYPAFVDEYFEDTIRTVSVTTASSLEPVLVSAPQRLITTHATGFRPASGLRTVPRIVQSGQGVGGVIVLPLDGGPVDAIDAEWAHSAVISERRYWEELPALDVPIRVPDAALQEMLVAAARNVLQARERDGNGNPVLQVGPTVYRGLWMVDGHFLTEAAQYLGFDEQAGHGISALLSKVRPDGSINAMADLAGLEDQPHSKETAIALTTLVRQWELSGNDEWLRQLWPTITRAVEHIAELRRRADELPTDSSAHGLMPPALADGGVAGSRPELTTSLWTLIGLRKVANAARQVAPAHYERVDGMYEQLRERVRIAARRFAGTLPDGTPYTPMILPGSGAHHTQLGVDDPPPQSRIRPESATWALAQAIWPGEVFAADDPIVRSYLHLLATLDTEERIPANTGWLPYRAVWTYYASFAAHVWLFVGRWEKAVELLYGMCNHASPTRVWREEQPLAATGHDQLWGDMPHNWASGELVRLVRALLVFERADELELLAGVPAGWIDDPDGVTISRTPTRFGEVSLRAYRPDPRQAGIVVIGLKRRTSTQAIPRSCRVQLPEGQWRVEFNGTDLGERQGSITVDATAG